MICYNVSEWGIGKHTLIFVTIQLFSVSFLGKSSNTFFLISFKHHLCKDPRLLTIYIFIQLEGNG